MSIPDTIVWLANFPATHAYEMVFLGSFSAMGLIGLALRRGPSRSRLEQLRIERGLRDPDPSLGARIVAQARSWSFVALALVVLASLAIALASLLFGPITRGCIYDHGVRADTIVDDEGGWFETVTFDAENGTRYTLNLPFFSPVTYPDRDATATGTDPLVVRYLPGHPQAYVVDTRESLDSWGEPIGE